MKRVISILLVFVFIATVFVIPSNAASYPTVIYTAWDAETTNVIPYGETGTIVFQIFREFNNEKLHIEIYDSNDDIVANATCSYGSGGSLIVRQLLTIDTEELDMGVGEYTIKYWMEFYSIYEWHTAPNSYTRKIKVIKNVCKGNHNMVFKETFTEADCTSDGSDIYQCTKCAYYRYRDTTGGHSFGEWEYYSATQHQHTCTLCSETESETHSWDNGIITIKPTENTSGKKTYTCTDCFGTYDETIYLCSNDNHTFDNDCDSECNDCGTERTVGDHILSGWIVDKEATVYKDGSMHKECEECGKILETEAIPQLICSKPELKTIANTTSGVKITWNKVKGADKYRVYRKKSGGEWEYIGSTSKNYYTDKEAKSGAKFYYAIRSNNEAGTSARSNSLSKFYLDNPTLKTPKSTKSGVSLKWTKTTGAQGYIIYRKTGSGSYKKLKTEKGVSNLSYVDKSAKKGKKYTYKVKAYYSKTYSAYSNTKTIKDKY